MDAWAMVDDVWQMFENAWTFNRRGTKVYKYCTKVGGKGVVGRFGGDLWLRWEGCGSLVTW